MALAYLFSSLLRTHRNFKIADNPTERAFAVVIDHKLRDNSTDEVSQVSRELKRLGMKAVTRTVRWREERMRGLDPSTLPNVESLARAKRYQLIGNTCQYLQASSLFFAHHQDDQYETVLMRLLGGHGYRGLQGMREANAIPECYDIHGVYKSGLLDDQLQSYPFLSFKPPNREMKRLRWILRDEKRSQAWDQDDGSLPYVQDASEPFPGQITRHLDPNVPYLKPIPSEDGGVTVYRPLLEFCKDRLIATCEANGVKWFEDHTNQDPKLTTRNAIRHITREHTLPKALQKPAILGLSQRSKRRAALEEAETRRLITNNNVIKDFDPNVGSLHIELPNLDFGRLQLNPRTMAARDEARRPRQKLYAALVARKVIEFVTPYQNLPPVTNLDNVIRRLYPHLYPDEAATAPYVAKTFSIAGVLFEPIASATGTQWYLTRAPYSSSKPLPERKLPGTYGHQMPNLQEHQTPRMHTWRSWKGFKSWDGRFWIRLNTCILSRFHVAPFLPEHAKPFRNALPPKLRARLERILKYHASGKTRYSIPAIYSVEEPSDKNSKMLYTLLALPSLGIHVPGLERWVKYDVRYRKVDVGLLGRKAKRVLVHRPQCSMSRRVRRKRVRRIQ